MVFRSIDALLVELMPKRNTRPSSPTLVLELPGRRQAAGVSLRQIVDSTKISLRFLEAIEFEQFEVLPGGIFGTSYIRQYAAAIGIDPAPLLDLYRRKLGLTPSPEAGVEGGNGKSDGTRRLGFSPTH